MVLDVADVCFASDLGETVPSLPFSCWLDLTQNFAVALGAD